MAGNLNVLGKSKKITLPLGWVEKISKKHPDRPFYFNESTGESRWSPPIDKDMEEPKRKGKKRKNRDNNNEEEFSDGSPSAANKLLNAITPERPKLKAKSVKATNDTKQSINDTPAMRAMREKIAAKKAALDAKKMSPKVVSQKQSKTLQSQKSTAQSSQTSQPSTSQRMTRRASSIISSNASISSNCSTISNTSSLGTKIKAAAIPIIRTPTKPVTDLDSFAIKKFSKIPRVQLVRTSTPSEKLSNSEKLANTSTDEENTISSAKKISKTPANERLDTFRKSLSAERNKNSATKRLKASPSVTNNTNGSSFGKSKLLDSLTPVLHTKAQTRLLCLENRVQNNSVLEINKSKTEADEEKTKSQRILEKVEVTDTFCEQMEWEPIEDEKIMSEVHSVRFQLNEKPLEKLSELSCNALQSVDNSGEKHALYIVIDTNVFLSNLSFIEEVRDSHSDIFGRPFLVIPWTVLQELDYIKDDKNHTQSYALKIKARKAVDFLNKHFTSKHPRFLGQTPSDVEKNKEKFLIECPDDEILQTCLQIKESSNSPVLLSYDKNLCNKAMIHDIPTLGRNDPLEKMYYLKAAETSDFLSNSLHARMEEKPENTTIKQKELLEADDIMEEGKAILKTLLSETVSKEMEELFGNRWELHVIVRPPWSIDGVLKCALKHWMAAVNESFTRRTERMLRDLQQCIHDSPNGGRKLQDVKSFLDQCTDVIQTLNTNKYPTLKLQMLTKIENLTQRCLNSIEEVNNARFRDSVGSEDDGCEEEKRASLAFKVFEEIYAFARDTCGIAIDALGLQCSFLYNKMHPCLTPKLALQIQQEVGVSVNNLVQVLRGALSKVDRIIYPTDSIILTLYEVLINFSSELTLEEFSMLTPVDIACCIRLRRSKLEKGYEQLQDLSLHFCRMANFQCT